MIARFQQTVTWSLRFPARLVPSEAGGFIVDRGMVVNSSHAWA